MIIYEITVQKAGNSRWFTRFVDDLLVAEEIVKNYAAENELQDEPDIDVYELNAPFRIAPLGEVSFLDGEFSYNLWSEDGKPTYDVSRDAFVQAIEQSSAVT